MTRWTLESVPRVELVGDCVQLAWGARHSSGVEAFPVAVIHADRVLYVVEADEHPDLVDRVRQEARRWLNREAMHRGWHKAAA